MKRLLLIVLCGLSLLANGEWYKESENLQWQFKVQSAGQNGYSAILVGIGVTKGYRTDNLKIPSVMIENMIWPTPSYSRYPLDWIRGAFKGMDWFSSVNIPGSVAIIDGQAFSDCVNLESVILNDGVRLIGARTFENCTKLESLIMPTSVYRIDSFAFRNCARLKVIDLTAVEEMGHGIFSGCSPALQIQMDESRYRFKDGLVYDSCNGKLLSWLCDCVDVNIENGVTNVAEFAMQDCQSVQKIVFAESVETIGMLACSGCANLETITIRNGVTSIGASAFANCPKLGRVIVDEGDVERVKEMLGGNVAARCAFVEIPRVKCPAIEPQTVQFDGVSQKVTISCATEGATVYYTIDGSEPSAANGRVYKGPFNIYDSVTVKAIAVKDDWKNSAVASAVFTKNNGLSAAINMYDYLPDNDANAPWTVVTDVSHDGVSSARSGAIGENGVTTMKVTVRGAGRLSFWWKSECEAWDEDYYDYGAFCVGSETEPRLRIAGMTDWKREEIVFDGTGKHVCKWEYHKDDAETIPRDCIWVDQVQWLPYGESEHDHTLTTEVPVPYLWLDSYGLGRETDFEAAAKMKLGKVDGAGRAMSIEDDYVAGTDPTNLESKLTATIKMGADGRPILSWKPPLNGEDEDGAGIREGVRLYSVYGKQTLDDAEEEWTPVADGDEGNYRFFKVGVGMP